MSRQAKTEHRKRRKRAIRKIHGALEKIREASRELHPFDRLDLPVDELEAWTKAHVPGAQKPSAPDYSTGFALWGVARILQRQGLPIDASVGHRASDEPLYTTDFLETARIALGAGGKHLTTADVRSAARRAGVTTERPVTERLRDTGWPVPEIPLILGYNMRAQYADDTNHGFIATFHYSSSVTPE
jgi:hypothetical protein